MKHRAFTLIEILIVIMIAGVVSVGLALSFTNGKAQADFKQAQSDITNLLQEARALSLANILIEDGGDSFETDYYHLDINTTTLTLTAYGADDSGAEVSSEINSVELNFPTEMEIDDTYDIYYIPPYGEVCFSYSGGCVYTSQPTEQTFRMERNDDGVTQEVDFTLSIYSAYPEVD